MERQLHLLEVPEPDWHLDDTTREIGRRGVAEARQALRRARKATAERRRQEATGDRHAA